MTNISSSIVDKAKGCLLGLALGDALGTSVEFKSRGSFVPLTDIVGGGPFKLKAGEWTDDTSMALCLADSLIANGDHNPRDQMDRYLRWRDEGENSSKDFCFDIGNTVNLALLEYEQTGNPYAGSDEKYSAGNGSLMRLAPIILFYGPGKTKNADDAIYFAGKTSQTTHKEHRCIDACKVLAWLVYHAIAGTYKNKNLLLNNVAKAFKNELHHEIQNIIDGSYKTKTENQIKGTGFVVDSLEAAIWSFYHSSNFRDGALLAANLGDDADTTAAIYGQIAGAFYGSSQLPTDWLKKLHQCEHIEELAKQLIYCPFKASFEKFLISILGVTQLTEWINDDFKTQRASLFLSEMAYHYNIVIPCNYDNFRMQLPKDKVHYKQWIDKADYIDLIKLFTSIIRNERFFSGLIVEQIQSGVLGELTKHTLNKIILKTQNNDE